MTVSLQELASHLIKCYLTAGPAIGSACTELPSKATAKVDVKRMTSDEYKERGVVSVKWSLHKRLDMMFNSIIGTKA